MIAATSTEAIRTRIADRLAQTLGPRKYAMWFERSAHLACDEGGALRVFVPNRFVADWIGRNFNDEMHAAASEALGPGAEVRVEVEPARFEGAGAEGREAAPARPAGESVPSAAQPAVPPVAPAFPAGRTEPQPRLRHSLDDFVVGPSNELAYAAASALAEERADAGHPLFLHGGCGLGKTHLLQGVCARLLERDPGAKVLYTTGEQFTNDYITAVRTNKLDAFRRRIRNLDLLAVDDVHFIANKQATQQEFLHSFDQIELGGARVILASDCHPKLIKQFSEALISRCVRGLVVQVHRPDTETRLRLVGALAQRRGLRLQPGVAEELARQSEGSVREIEGMLAKLQALASLGHAADAGTVGHTLVRQLRQNEGAGVRRRGPVRFETILQTVSTEMAVAAPQILGGSRVKRVVLARALVIHLARELTSMSYPEIAAAMKRPNHSTVITAAQRIQKQIEAAEPLLLPDVGGTTPGELVDRLRKAVLGA